jgi:hypothetical protein
MTVVQKNQSSGRSVQDVFVMQASHLEALENCSAESSALTSVRPPRPTGLRVAGHQFAHINTSTDRGGHMQESSFPHLSPGRRCSGMYQPPPKYGLNI